MPYPSGVAVKRGVDERVGLGVLSPRNGADPPAIEPAQLASVAIPGEEELELEPAYEGNAYDDPDAPRVPTTLAQAMDLWRSSDFARRTFGDDVVEHYANMAAVEVAAFGRSVTDWERFRGFERL